MPLESGQIIDGKYRIVRLIGQGGMGEVYEGEHVRIRRRVAVKILHAATASNADSVLRFEREAQAAGRIGSDHILEVLDLGSLPNGDRFMVMEYLDGEPLSSRIRGKQRLSAHELVPIARQVLAGLSAAHAAGIIHRDLKPDNIFILREKAGQADYVKLIDFGISKFQAMLGEVTNMTRTGTIMGTPYYMAPEQATGSVETDVRSDLYAIGVILFEAVTGRVPFQGRSFNELLFNIALSPAPSPLELAPDLDPAFASIVSKAMTRSKEQRFQTASEFVDALDDWTRTGRGVTIPPEMPHQAIRTDAGGRQSTVAVAPGQGFVGVDAGAVGPAKQTMPSWATSQAHDTRGPKRPPKGLLVGSVVGALVLGAVALGVRKMVGGRDAESSPVVSSAVAPSSAAQATEPPPTAFLPAPTPPLPADDPPVVAEAVDAGPSSLTSPPARIELPRNGRSGEVQAPPSVKTAPRRASPQSTGKPAGNGGNGTDWGY